MTTTPKILVRRGGRQQTIVETRSAGKEQKAAQESRPLFHYTTASGLMGILQSQTLWAGHFEFSNDSTECIEIQNLLEPIFRNELQAIVPQLVKAGAFRDGYLKDHGIQVYALEARNIFGVFLKSIKNISPFFITSFCHHDKDSLEYQHGLLSQWRGYGRGGFAIEFDEKKLDELSAQEHARNMYTGYSTNMVEYEDHEKRATPAQFKGAASAMMRALVEGSTGQDVSNITGKKEVAEFVRPFLETAPFLKNRAFIEEREYRIVMMCNRPSRLEESDKRPVKTIRFRVGPRGGLAPYIELFAGMGSKLPIKSIIVGPHPEQIAQKDAVELLLEQNSIEAPVRMSGAPFRD